jgi:BolA protein
VSVHAEAIRQALEQALGPQSVEVDDDSHLHAGHAGAREGRHFSVRVVAERFNGLSRVARHRLIYDALNSLIPQGIHALAIDARAPGEPPSPSTR